MDDTLLPQLVIHSPLVCCLLQRRPRQMRWANPVLPSGHGWIIGERMNNCGWGAPIKDPTPNFLLFQLRRKQTSRRSQATLQSHHHLPSPSHHRSSRTLMLLPSHDPSPTALHRPRSTMLLVIAPFLTTRRTLSPILDTSMQILVNCGYRDLR